MTGEIFRPSTSGLEILCRLDTLAGTFFSHLDRRLKASLIFLSIHDSIKNDETCHHLLDIRSSEQDKEHLAALQETAAVTIEKNRHSDEDSLKKELEISFKACAPEWSFFAGEPSRYQSSDDASSIQYRFPVLRLPSDPYRTLQQSVTDEDSQWSAAHSYIDALIQKFMELVHLHTSMKILTNEARLYPVDEKPLVSHLCREAARRFLASIGELKNGKALPELFDTLCSLAAITYEGVVNRGRLIITEEKHDLRISERMVEFVEPVKLSHIVAARKVLEMSSKDFPAISDGELILGICTGLPGKIDEKTLFVEFINHKGWRLMELSLSQPGDALSGELLVVKDGSPHLYDPHPDIHRLYAAFQKIFGGCENLMSDSELLYLISQAKAQRRGTMLLISEAAEKEAHRLKDQATVITPRPLVKGAGSPILSLTAIDGTILITPDGTCHAIGMILDGTISAGKGDSSRGARYNNALRYVDTSPHRCMAVVFSMDGEIDVFPAL